jgi:hypothetical protein
VLHSLADRHGQDVEDDLSDDEEETSEENITQWPSVLQRSRHEDDLHESIHQQAYPRNDIEEDEQHNGTIRPQRAQTPERSDRNKEGNREEQE